MSEADSLSSTERKRRKAILDAATFIESHPKRFDFESVYVPNNKRCGSPGCALGWIAHFYGIREKDGPMILDQIAQATLSIDYWGEFDARMNALSAAGKWRESAKECAATLKRYAEKYHPERKS